MTNFLTFSVCCPIILHCINTEPQFNYKLDRVTANNYFDEYVIIRNDGKKNQTSVQINLNLDDVFLQT